MPGFILHFGASLQCAHLGMAQPMVVQPRVLLSGQAVVTLTSPYGIVGCSLAGTGTPPCATAQFLTGATRVFAMGQPVLLVDSQSKCLPTGTPLIPLAGQIRVTGV